MGTSLGNVVSNSFEDLLDEYSTTVIFKQSKKAFDPLRKDFESDKPSDWDDAVAGAITTLQMGISMYALNWINSTLLPALARRGSIAFTYIFAGSLAKRAKKVRLGGKAMRKVTRLVGGIFEQRQKNTQIAMDMVQHSDSMHMQKMNLASRTKSSFDSNMLGGKSDIQARSVVLMTQKTKTGTWRSSREDKKLYESATGQKLSSGVSWSSLYKKLNSFQEFARNVEGDIINDAQVKFDTFVGHGLTKPKG